MLGSLLITAWLMGLAGLGHCAVMCGAACAGAVQVCAGSPERRGAAAAYVQLGRLIGYAALGALAAGGMGWIRALSAQSLVLRPLWGMAQAVCLAVGVWLLLRGQAPTWLDGWSWPLRSALRRLETSRLRDWPVSLKALAVGAGWAALPCGQLYAALAMAALASNPLGGAATMAAYALPGAAAFLGVSAVLERRRTLAPTLPSEGQRATIVGPGSRSPASRAWLMRLSGLGLVVVSVWALVHMFSTDPAAWCTTA